MKMRKFILCLTVLCMFAAATVEAFACANDDVSCSSHELQTKDDSAKAGMDTHSCCHAHIVNFKVDRVEAAQVVSHSSYIITNDRIYSQFRPDLPLEPPSQA